MAINGKPRKIDYNDWSKPELIREIKKLEKRKKYGLIWDEERTKEIFEEELQKKLPVLNEIKSNQILTNPKQPINILIEGDNYHALSVLNYTHKGKIDVIYIDPPYNTGKEFTYNDKIVDAEDSYKHSKWLSFMQKRLELAKKLLSKKGVIFISIDDNEQAQLKLLCNEIFNEENFVANIVWQKKFSPQNDAKYFSDMHDFILVYARKKNINGEKDGWIRNLLPRTEEMNLRYKNPDNDPRGLWASGGLDVKTYSEQYDYPITTPSGRVVNPPKGTCWRVPKARLNELIKDNRIWFGENGNNVPRIKRFLSEVQAGIVPTTWWDIKFAGHNQDAKQELNRINIEQPFDNPKPVKLIRRILEIASDKNSIVLDFMAGSGTTGNAVLELNKNDNGNRKFIGLAHCPFRPGRTSPDVVWSHITEKYIDVVSSFIIIL
ncbi:MAG TPA: site-specific DNA-methyltransferase [Candidatus Acidoferrum sp.]|nr:site-specific DNA-methyltransferase [Candidatus Acidoferrum sp.]